VWFLVAGTKNNNTLWKFGIISTTLVDTGVVINDIKKGKQCGIDFGLVRETK
jgi:hypothetical protein